jgi:cyclophilin family peptidyl-prolyl cis-trans isomerase
MKQMLIVFMAISGFTACNAQDDTGKMPSKENQTKTETVQTEGKEMTVAVMKTNMGTIEIELFADQTPKTVENFVKHSEAGYYKGVIFHRVIANFMIQGGDPTGTGRGGESIWGKPFEDEIVSSLVFDKPGLLAMANAGPNTNGSQFFITVAPTTWLNGNHTIFGEVINGMDVVYAISKVQTSKPGDKPLKDVVIESVTIEKRKQN